MEENQKLMYLNDMMEDCVDIRKEIEESDEYPAMEKEDVADWDKRWDDIQHVDAVCCNYKSKKTDHQVICQKLDQIAVLLSAILTHMPINDEDE